MIGSIELLSQLRRELADHDALGVREIEAVSTVGLSHDARVLPEHGGQASRCIVAHSPCA